MFIGHIDDCKTAPVQFTGAKGVTKQVPIAGTEGWEDYVLRVFTLDPKGYTPRHHHPWPHINWVVSGEGMIELEGQNHPVREGSYAFIPGGANHQFTNTGDRPFVFICIVPTAGDQ